MEVNRESMMALQEARELASEIEDLQGKGADVKGLVPPLAHLICLVGEAIVKQIANSRE